MYTQCPDCGTSFRVTAVVLKQAAGKVRCGGCGDAFNALAYLSESKPNPSTRTEVDGSLPELTPDPVDTEADAATKPISPEQSAALLKTLDQLAGEDIRLEDTGVEWRVLGNDEDEDQVPELDELVDKKLTHVDEFLTKTLAWYATWWTEQKQHLNQRDRHIADLAFPFEHDRPHQQARARRAYRALCNGEHLLLEAPTGSGKTMALIYPAVKSLNQETIQKILFLTSKNTGAAAAKDACRQINPDHSVGRAH